MGDGLMAGIVPMARIVKQGRRAQREAREGSGAMKMKNGSTAEVLVGRDPSGSFVELQTAGGGIMDQPRGVLLTQEEARRLAAIILFEAGKLDAPATEWLPAVHARRSA